jgi:DNA replication protein DnaC
MLNTPTLDKLRDLKLKGMITGLEEQMASSKCDSLSFEERLGMLVDVELATRENRRLKTRLAQAKLRMQACVEDIDYSSSRQGLDRSLIQSLHDCNWIKKGLNMIITGPTGIGKSYLACAFAHRACLMGYKTRYFRASKLFGELQLVAADGRYPKFMNSLSKLHLIVIDDWGLVKLNDQAQGDLLEIVEERYGIHSTIIAGQMPVDHWHEIIGNPTLADAILDRVVHSAYRINLDGDSMRKKKAKS